MPDAPLSHARSRWVARWLLALMYGAAGYLHLTNPAPFLKITPGWVPEPALMIYLTGWCEVAGAVALAQPWSAGLRRQAGYSLAAYALCVWPANINHLLMDMRQAGHGLGWAYHGPRMLAQPLLIWLAAWAGGGLDWPLARRAQ